MTNRQRYRKRLLCRALIFVLVAGLLTVVLRVAYSFTDSGKFGRLLHALTKGDDPLVDKSLAKVGLLAPLPEGHYREQVMLDILKSIRALTLDEYASLVDSEQLGYEAREALRVAGDPRAIRPILVALREGRAFDNELPELWAKCGDGPFLDLLSDPDASVRADVLDFLARAYPDSTDTSRNAPVLPLLQDPSPDVRIAAAEFLVTRGNDNARSVLLAEFERMAEDESEYLVWERKVRRGQMSVEDMQALFARFERVRGILRMLSRTGDTEVAEILRSHDERQALTRNRKKAEALAKTYSPGDDHWRLYAFLLPKSPNLGYYSPKVNDAGELDISPPYIVPVSKSVDGAQIKAGFGPPDQVIPSVAWEIRLGEEKTSFRGVVWKYGDDLEVLLVDGRARAVKTARPDARVLFGGLVPEQEPTSGPETGVTPPLPE